MEKQLVDTNWNTEKWIYLLFKKFDVLFKSIKPIKKYVC